MIDKHTPGPWSWDGRYLDAGTDTIATTFRQTTKANRDLIAAAPDMLEALRFVKEHALALKGSPMFETVARAIAKAEGKD